VEPVKGFSTTVGVVAARHRHDHTLMAALAVTAVTTITLVAALTGTSEFALGLLAIGPCLASITGRPRMVTAIGVYTIVVGALLLWLSDQAVRSTLAVQHGLALAVISVVGVVIAYRRQILEQTAGQAEAHRSALAAVVEDSDDAIITKTLDGTILTWNGGAERMFGYRPDEAIGAHISLITSRAEIANLPGIFARVARGERIDHYETQRICKDGTVLDVSVSVSPLRDNTAAVTGASAITRDITGSKKAHTAQRVLAAVVESSDDAIIAKTLDGTITAWNPGAERMYGYLAGEAIGHNISMVTPPAEQAESTDILTRVGHGEQIEHYETHRTRKDGTVLDVSVSTSPIHDDTGTVIGASAITHDITERKHAEATRRDLEERSQQAQRLQSLGQLAGGIAHDFNNLLAIILNYSDFITEQSPEGSDLRADAQKIHVAGERGTALTRQLLVFARGEPTPTEVFDLNVVVAEARSLLAGTIGAHIALVAKPAPTPVLITADRGQIHQILLNLAINSRDAMPDGGTLLIEVTTADLDENADLQPVLARGTYARILVSDTGVGMSAEVAKHILEPFFTTKPKGRGTGLGMATVYGIVTQAGGGLNIYSEIDLGTTIRIYFPLAEVPATAAARPLATPAHGTGQTVVVAEDEEALRQVVDRILGANGYLVRSAGTGADALLLLAEHHSDLLLTDMVMPQMSGRQLAERAHRLYPDLPVLYMSGYSDGQLTDQHLLTEGTALLQKPFTADDLLRAVHTQITKPHERNDVPRIPLAPGVRPGS
jgi:PAS domain S-box-containing protein